MLNKLGGIWVSILNIIVGKNQKENMLIHFLYFRLLDPLKALTSSEKVSLSPFFSSNKKRIIGTFQAEIRELMKCFLK